MIRFSPTFPKKKVPLKKIKEKLWQCCRQLADIRYPKPICYTCDAVIEGNNKQLGHFIAKSICGGFLKYDLRNLRWQCMRCNQFAGGNGATFYKRLVEQEGQEYVDQLMRDRNKVIKENDFYPSLLTDYENQLEAIKNAL